MNGSSSWIEPPPPQHGFGCFAKGCLILLVFFILLVLSFIAGTYYATKYLKAEYFSTHHEPLPISQTTIEEEERVRARWDRFRRAARAHEAMRIELTADEINALLAADHKLRGNAFVTIEDNTAHFQISYPVGEGRWLRGRYINAQCTVQSAPSGKPEEAHITNIVVNGRPVGEEFLSWQYGAWSYKRYVTDWTSETNLKTFEIADGKVILETSGSSNSNDNSSSTTTITSDDPFASTSATPSPSPATSPPEE